jgi:hypothetical protein
MADLGNKHECLSCGTKFYDLGRSQLVCPSCGEDQEELAKGAAEGDHSGTKPSATKAKKTKRTKKTKKTKKTDKDEASEDKEEEASSSDK